MTAGTFPIGTAQRVVARLRLPFLIALSRTGAAPSGRSILCEVCREYGLVAGARTGDAASAGPSAVRDASGSGGGGGGDGAGGAGAAQAAVEAEWCDVYNRRTLGRSEVQLAGSVLGAAAELLEVERRLALGEGLLEAMTPPPPLECAPAQLTASLTRRVARDLPPLRSLTLSVAPLPVHEWGAKATYLSLAGMRLYDRDAALLSGLLALSSGLRSLDLSQCRLTERGTLAVVRGIATARPARLSELRLADNRLRVSGTHALLDALEAAGASIAVLDLSANELCGGTVAEDHFFGLVKGAAARISENGALCRLDSDGLCSAGPKVCISAAPAPAPAPAPCTYICPCPLHLPLPLHLPPTDRAQLGLVPHRVRGAAGHRLRRRVRRDHQRRRQQGVVPWLRRPRRRLARKGRCAPSAQHGRDGRRGAGLGVGRPHRAATRHSHMRDRFLQERRGI